MNRLPLTLQSKISPEPNSGCWLWVGCTDKYGYGRVKVDGKKTHVHRQVMILLGHDLKGMEVDHLCRVRGCCNPDHLEVVTGKENLRRMWEVRRKNASKND